MRDLSHKIEINPQKKKIEDNHKTNTKKKTNVEQ